MRSWKIAVIITVLDVVMLSGCGTAATPPMPTATPKATATPTIAHAGQSAEHLLAGLKAKGLPIGESVVFTAATDENSLLGRPGQYISKASWKDKTIADCGQSGPDIGADCGGSIETFANATDAQRRYVYVSNIAASGGVFAEYDYLDGDALLRLTRFLTPDQANTYHSAFTTLP